MVHYHDPLTVLNFLLYVHVFVCVCMRVCVSIQGQLDSEAEAMRASQRELLSVEDTVYMPDRDPEPVNRTLIQRAGYLNIRK